MKWLASAINHMLHRRNLTQQQTLAELMTAVVGVQSRLTIELTLLAAGIKAEDMPQHIKQRPVHLTLNTTCGKWEVIGRRMATAGGRLYVDVATDDEVTMIELQDLLKAATSLGIDRFYSTRESNKSDLPYGFSCDLAIGPTAETAMKQWLSNGKI